MGDYFIRYGDGDLESVVRGGAGGYHPPSSYCNAPVPFGSLIQEDIGFDFSSIPEFFETETVFDDELEALYKPFYPTNINPLSPQSSTISSTTFGFEQRSDHSENKVQEKETSSSGSPVVDTTHHQVKYKRRKNQQKRVVMQVKEEDLSSDKWAWRKYGQKPIKGSPYPRSYYRCSSSKGCLARKQVERNLSDPETFIITYTAEHCHGHPTRRNSLAGTTRNKYSISAPKSPGTIIDHNPNTSSTPKSCSYSPMEDELMFQEEIKMERIEGEANVQEMGEMLLRDDFIVKFDEMGMVNYDVDYSRSDMWFGIN